ncbi:hypothetical protein HU200_061984 [Digitaria exilis]|uniref:Uncharacterized protein n=1 Tax=Digitaria exilis TaxID=1010633 RepID=A0A835ABE3_9POAL|nr:hypothetical protein HU200_061984 [Digitaria exilis]
MGARGPDAHPCHVGSSVAETLDRVRELGARSPGAHPLDLGAKAPGAHLPYLKTAAAPFLSSSPLFLFSLLLRQDAPRRRRWRPFCGRRPPAPAPTPTTLGKDARVPPALPSLQCECGKPARVTQSMHPDTAARAYYKCGDHRAKDYGARSWAPLSLMPRTYNMDPNQTRAAAAGAGAGAGGRRPVWSRREKRKRGEEERKEAAAVLRSGRSNGWAPGDLAPSSRTRSRVSATLEPTWQGWALGPQGFSHVGTHVARVGARTGIAFFPAAGRYPDAIVPHRLPGAKSGAIPQVRYGPTWREAHVLTRHSNHPAQHSQPTVTLSLFYSLPRTRPIRPSSRAPPSLYISLSGWWGPPPARSRSLSPSLTSLADTMGPLVSTDLHLLAPGPLTAPLVSFLPFLSPRDVRRAHDRDRRRILPPHAHPPHRPPMLAACPCGTEPQSSTSVPRHSPAASLNLSRRPIKPPGHPNRNPRPQLGFFPQAAAAAREEEEGEEKKEEAINTNAAAKEAGKKREDNQAGPEARRRLAAATSSTSSSSTTEYRHPEPALHHLASASTSTCPALPLFKPKVSQAEPFSSLPCPCSATAGPLPSLSDRRVACRSLNPPLRELAVAAGCFGRRAASWRLPALAHALVRDALARAREHTHARTHTGTLAHENAASARSPAFGLAFATFRRALGRRTPGRSPVRARLATRALATRDRRVAAADPTAAPRAGPSAPGPQAGPSRFWPKSRAEPASVTGPPDLWDPRADVWGPLTLTLDH